MKVHLRRIVLDGLFGVLVGIVTLILLLLGCHDPDDQHPGDDRQPASWADCEVRTSAPLQVCPSLAAAAFSVRGRTSNFQRVAALVCCTSSSFNEVQMFSAETAAALMRRRASFR